MKRFWKDAAVEKAAGGWRILIDGKGVRTPARAELVVPGETLAKAIAAEWDAVEGEVDPRAMPMTGLANAAIDRVAPDRAVFAAGLARYAEADLACYRADGPPALADRQAGAWDVLLGWARRRYDVDFAVTTGITHVEQPAATVERLSHEVSALDPFRLAALSPMVTAGGSLVAALAVLDGAWDAAKAWDAVSVDDAWQCERWGSDSEAEKALEGRRRDFMAGARFLALVAA
ncbi:MAG: ATP12 family protein [Sphingomicrobium sp.]